jgi:hypothetical protein
MKSSAPGALARRETLPSWTLRVREKDLDEHCFVERRRVSAEADPDLSPKPPL